MNELNEEIKLTINLMQTDIDNGAHGELQSHLYSLLEIKRNVLEQRLVERSWAESAKPLTADELKAGWWWCDDISEVCRLAFVEKGVATRFADWSFEGENKYCYLSGIVVARTGSLLNGLKQIHRIGNEFYWSEK